MHAPCQDVWHGSMVPGNVLLRKANIMVSYGSREDTDWNASVTSCRCSIGSGVAHKLAVALTESTMLWVAFPPPSTAGSLPRGGEAWGAGAHTSDARIHLSAPDASSCTAVSP